MRTTGTASLVVVEASADFGEDSSAFGAARTAITPSSTSATLDIPAREPGHRIQVHLVDSNDDGLFQPGEPHSATPGGPGSTFDLPTNALSTTDTATSGLLAMPSFGPPTDDVVARAIYDRSIDDDKATLVLDARSNRRYVREVLVTAGPAISGVTYPFSLFLGEDGRFVWMRKFESTYPTGTFTFQYHFADGSTRVATRGLTAPIATPSTPSHTGPATTNFLWVGCNLEESNPTCTANLVAEELESPPESSTSHDQVQATVTGDLKVTTGDDPTVKIRSGTTGTWGAALTRPLVSGFQIAAGPPSLDVLYGAGGGGFVAGETWDVRHTFARISATPTITWTSENTGERLVKIEFLRPGEDHGRVVLRRVTGAGVSVAVPAALGLPVWDDLEVHVREFVGGHVSGRPVAPWVTVGP